MGVIWRDTFERPDGILTGADYSNMGGEPDAPLVGGQVVSTVDALFAYQNAARASLYAQYRVTCDLSTAGGGILLFFTPTLAGFNDRYNLYLPHSATPGFGKIVKTVAGVFTDLVTGIPLPAVNALVRFEKQGTTLTVSFDGAQQAAVSDASLAGPFYAACNLDGTGGTVSLDDFEIGDITLGASFRPNTRPRPFAPGIAR